MARVYTVPIFLVESRKIIYTTNAIESLNARFRKANGGPPC